MGTLYCERLGKTACLRGMYLSPFSNHSTEKTNYTILIFRIKKELLPRTDLNPFVI